MDTKDKQKKDKAPFWTSTRFGMAVLLSFGLYCAFSIRVNVNMAIVCMVNYTALNVQTEEHTDNSSKCGLISTSADEVKYKDGSFAWDRIMQGHILSIFYLPYGIAQTPTSVLITKYGARLVFGVATVLAAVVTILIPVAANYSFILVVVIRGLIGALTAGVYICCQYIFGRWAPPNERTRLSSVCFAGIEFGTIGTYFISGLMCDHIMVNGWSYIFYVTGGSTLLWCLCWFVFVADTPEQSNWISKQEKEYINKTMNITQEIEDKNIEINKHAIPWRSLFTSLPLYAIMVANFCSDWAHILMWTYVPTYLNDVFGFDYEYNLVNSGENNVAKLFSSTQRYIADAHNNPKFGDYNGFISAISSIPHAAAILISGRLSDFVIHRNLSRTTTRKLFNTTSMVVPAVLLIVLCYIDCSQSTLAIVVLITGMAIRGFRFSGYIVNAMDITPNFGGVVFGITNTMGSLSAYATLMVASSLTTNLSREEWKIVFFITSAIEICGSLFYLLFASADIQPWNDRNIVKINVKRSELPSEIETNHI